ncbi:transposase [Streptomyces sp. NPDC002537]
MTNTQRPRHEGEAAKRGQHTGPSPVDRGRAGSKHHLITDGHGTPLTVPLAGANRGRRHPADAPARRRPTRERARGPPRRKPDSLFADRGYGHDIYRDRLRERRIVPAIAHRGALHGTGLGTYRWVVERIFAWLHGLKRLRLACCLITLRQINSLH